MFPAFAGKKCNLQIKHTHTHTHIHTHTHTHTHIYIYIYIYIYRNYTKYMWRDDDFGII